MQYSFSLRMRLLHRAAYPRGHDKTKTKVGVEKIWIEPDRTGSNRIGLRIEEKKQRVLKNKRNQIVYTKK